MTVNIKGQSSKIYTFEGAYSSTSSTEDRSGVYAILDYNGDNCCLIDVGESAQVKTRLDNHDRKPCWYGKQKGNLKCAVYYTPNLQQQGRMLVEQDIRAYYNNLCGDR